VFSAALLVYGISITGYVRGKRDRERFREERRRRRRVD